MIIAFIVMDNDGSNVNDKHNSQGCAREAKNDLFIVKSSLRLEARLIQ